MRGQHTCAQQWGGGGGGGGKGEGAATSSEVQRQTTGQQGQKGK